jgi:type IV secretory pathway VirB4 component
LDPEGEYFPLVNALKGQVIKLSATSDNFLNPLDIIFDKRLTTEEDPIPDKIDFIVGLIELIVGGNGLTASERSLVDRAAKKIYEHFLDKAPTVDSIISVNLKSNILDNYSIEQVKLRLTPVQIAHINEQLDKALVEYGKHKMPILEDLYNELVGYGEAGERLSTSLEMYVYGSQKFFNHRSNIDIHNRVVCFDIKNLGASLKKLGMLIIQGSVWDTVSANRKANKKTRFYIDEFHLLLKNEQTAKYCVEFWKRFRKWGGIPCGITQNVQDLLRSSFAEHIDTIFSNTEFFYLLKQATDDREILMGKLNISPQQAEYITNSDPGCGLIIFGGVILPFDDKYPTDTQTYKYLTTKPGEVNLA